VRLRISLYPIIGWVSVFRPTGVVDTSTEHINIRSFPICGSEHRYALEVERSVVLTFMTFPPTTERRRRMKVTRLFTCPKGSKEFQGTFILTETSSSQIKSIKVVGITNDTEQQ